MGKRRRAEICLFMFREQELRLRKVAEVYTFGLGRRIATYSLRHFTENHFFLVIKPTMLFMIATDNYNVTLLFSHKIKVCARLALFFSFQLKHSKAQILRDEPKVRACDGNSHLIQERCLWSHRNPTFHPRPQTSGHWPSSDVLMSN